MLLNVLSAVISIQQFDNQLSGILNILFFIFSKNIYMWSVSDFHE